MKVVQGNGMSSQEDPYRVVRQRMNAIRVSEPLIGALIERPGLGSSAGAMSEAVGRLSTAYRKATEDLLTVIAPSEVQRKGGGAPFRAIVSRMMARVIALVWKSGAVEDPTAIAARAVAIVRPLVETIEPLPTTVFTDLPATTQEAMSEAAALTRAAPVLLRLGRLPEKARKLLIGRHTVEEAAERIRAILREQVALGSRAVAGAQAPTEQSPAGRQAADPDGRWHLNEAQMVAVRSGVLASVAQVLSSSLESNFDARMGVLRAMDPAGRKSAFDAIMRGPDTWGVLDRVATDVGHLCESVLFSDIRAAVGAQARATANVESHDAYAVAGGA